MFSYVFYCCLLLVCAALLVFCCWKYFRDKEISKALLFTRSLADFSPIMTVMFDKNRDIIEVSRHVCQKLNLEKSLCKTYGSIFPQYQPCGAPSVEKISHFFDEAQKVSKCDFEWAFQAADGKLIYTNSSVSHICCRGKDVFVLYAYDVTEIKSVLEKEKKTNKFVKSFIENSPYVINLWNSDIQLESTSKQSVKMFGLKDTQEYLDRFSELSPKYQPCGTLSNEKAVMFVKEAFRTGSVQFEWMHQDLSGNPIPTEIFLLRFDDGEDLKVIATTTDLRNVINSQKKCQEAEAVSQACEDENRAKTRFLAKMSHEIRTPLNSILGVTEAQLENPEMIASSKEAFLHIYNSSTLMLAIINDILDLSKIEAGKMTINCKAYEFTSMIVDTLQLNLIMIGDKNIEFSLDLDDNIPLSLTGDETCLKQVLNNLLSNAIKYTDSGKVSLSVRADKDESASFDDGVMLIFTVKDTGQGMTQEQVDSLFNEFIRYNVEVNKNIKGTGLGMSIVRQLVNIMGGRIDVKSEVNVGTEFNVYIPQIARGKEVLGENNVENLQNLQNIENLAKKVKKIKRDPMPYGRILVVDDVESNIVVIKKLLKLYEIDAQAVNSGKKAIEKIKSGEVYDVIFMDHVMPEMDGIDATKIIRELGYEEPIIALTANAFMGAADMFKEKGFCEYLSKPIDITSLDSFLIRYVRDRKNPLLARQDNKISEKGFEKNGETVEETRPKEVFTADKSEENVDNSPLMQAFLMDARKTVADLETFLPLKEGDKNSLNAFIIHAHSMKSAFYNIGREEMSKFAAGLETAGKENDIAKINAQAPELLYALQEIVRNSRSK